MKYVLRAEGSDRLLRAWDKSPGRWPFRFRGFIFPRPSAPSAWARQTVARWAEPEWIAQHQNLQASGRHIVLLAGRRIHSLARRACMAEKRSEGFVIYLAVSDSERSGLTPKRLIERECYSEAAKAKSRE